MHRRRLRLGHGGGEQKDFLRIGHFDLDDARPQRFENRQAFLHTLSDIAGRAVVIMVGRHADFQSLDAAGESLFVIGSRFVDASRILGIGAGDDARQARAVVHGAGERAHGVLRPGARHDAVAADQAVGGLQSHHAARGSRQPHRAAGVRSQRAIAGACRHRRTRAARRAAGHVRRVPRVAAMSPVVVVSGRIGGELRHVETTQPDRAGGGEPLDDGRCYPGPVIAQDVRAAGGDFAGAVIHVLVRKRHPVQRAQPGAALQRLVRLPGRFQRFLGFDRNEAVELWLHARGMVKAGAGNFDRRHFLPADRAGDLDQAQIEQFGRGHFAFA